MGSTELAACWSLLAGVASKLRRWAAVRLRSWWGCTPPLMGVTRKVCCLAPGSLRPICRPAIEGLNSENHGRVCLITGFWHFQGVGWPLLTFGFFSHRGGWDFWCDRPVCVWLTRGQGFLRDARPRERCKAICAAGLCFVPVWKLEGLAVWLCHAACQRKEGCGLR